MTIDLEMMSMTGNSKKGKKKVKKEGRKKGINEERKNAGDRGRTALKCHE